MLGMKKFICMVLVVLVFLFAFVLTTKAFEDLLNPERDYLIIVNDENPYEFGGYYDCLLQDDLVYCAEVLYGETTALEKAAYLAFTKLQYELGARGMEIGLYSGYRTEQEQMEVYDYYGHLEGWAETNKVTWPGYSEHHTGLVANVLIKYGESDDKRDWIWYTETAERQETIPYFQLFHEVIADYGFIDRYPAGKEEITGFPSEPYEIRFVGSAEVAHAIMDNGLTLEEYVEWLYSE